MMERPVISSGVLLATRHRNIVEGAAEAVAVLGATNAGVAELVQFSGCARKTFYDLFGNREDCLRQLLDVGAGELLEAARDHGVAGLLGYLHEHPSMARCLIVEGWTIDGALIVEHSTRFAELLGSPAGPREEFLVGGVTEMLRRGLAIDGVDTLPDVKAVSDFLSLGAP